MSFLKWSTNEVVEKSSHLDKVKYLSLKKEVSNSTKLLNDFNNRNLVNKKLNDRYMTNQMNKNPFLSNNNYLDDLKIRDEYLIPNNSHQ